ncbi:MAG: signal peptidase I [Candidatus Schekmanbacteria bacterium]|nr:signal peptidase I [Candidatus Schekmanbacteria bacterium]
MKPDRQLEGAWERNSREPQKDDDSDGTGTEVGGGRTMLREYSEAFIIAIILALFIRTFLFQAFKIPSGSMLPTLQIGDQILVNKIASSSPLPCLGFSLVPLHEPQREDIVVFKFPNDLNRDFIKRIVGQPSQSVRLEGHTLFVDGSAVDEPYAHYERSSAVALRRSGETYDVSPAHYLVFGDNRDNSQDSRYWGLLPRDYIKGKAFLIYWSWDPTGKRVRTERLLRLLR